MNDFKARLNGKEFGCRVGRTMDGRRETELNGVQR